MRDVAVKPRQARRYAGRSVVATPTDLANTPFRADRDRVASSPFFARLAGVTQVVSPTGSGLLLHNRLTHSLKVAQVARAIADRLAVPENVVLLDKLGGCDPDVVEAAALAHDLGHPPFGHLGEEVLDRIARHRFGLPDGFEGNAQSYRIVTTTDTHGPGGLGLDLTAAVRAAVLKYPWLRRPGADPDHPSRMPRPPRGAAEPAEYPGSGSAKFSAYVTELADLVTAREPFAGRVEPWQQTVEASVMDTADDIAYAIHDLEDFHRVGVLQHATVAAELGEWRARAVELAGLDADRLAAESRLPGRALESLRRRLHAKDAWVVDDDAFAEAVYRVRAELVDGLLAVPFDGSTAAEQTVARFSANWIARLVEGVVLTEAPPTRAGHVLLATRQWHEVQVLKFVHRRFVLLRPDLALHQHGQARLLTALVEELDQWLGDRREADRLPRRLHDLVDLASDEYGQLAATRPELLAPADAALATGGGVRGGAVSLGADEVRALAKGRAVIDFVASLTDNQAAALLDALSGRRGQLWTDAFAL